MMNKTLKQPSAKSAMMDLLSRRGYSQSRLETKLSEKGFESPEIATAVAMAKEYGWIDDEEFAASLTRSKLASGYGPNYIRQHLVSKGIERDLADQILREGPWDWWPAIERAFSKKYQQVPKDWQTRRKCSAYLYRRGFDSELIRTFIEHQQSLEND